MTYRAAVHRFYGATDAAPSTPHHDLASCAKLVSEIELSDEVSTFMISQWFLALLAKLPSASELASFLRMRRANPCDEELVAEILDNSELQGIAFVTDTFKKLLGREPSEAELASFSLLHRNQICRAIFQLGEYRQMIVKGAFCQILGRFPSEIELTRFSGSRLSIRFLRQYCLCSPEFFYRCENEPSPSSDSRTA